MIKRLTEHTIYEVWNEYVAESCFVDHKPTKQELIEICEKEKWILVDVKYATNQYIKQYIFVEKIKRIYTTESQWKEL